MTARTELPTDLLGRGVVAIAAITVVSGLVQLVAPGFVLGIIGGEASPSSAHFFAIVGMFMAIVGGLVLHAELTADARHVVLLWGSLQKYGAAVAVTIGVARGLFGALALAVAAFDLFSGGVMTWHWRRISR